MARRVSVEEPLLDDLDYTSHLSLEPGPREASDKADYPVRMRTWPGGEERLLGTARPHGIPVTWD